MQPEMQVWSVATNGGNPKLLGGGDAPAISPDNTRVAFTSGGAVMIAPVDGSVPAKRLFFDRGQDSELHWSPDGSALAFVSARTDHSFIGIYRNDNTPLEFIAPSTSQDFMPRWSPDGKSIAFVRLAGDGDLRKIRSTGRRRRGKFGSATSLARARAAFGRAQIRCATRYLKAAADHFSSGLPAIASSSRAKRTTGRTCTQPTRTGGRRWI